MDRINQVIREISGHDHKSCYVVLRQAVAFALEQMPEHPTMKSITLETAKRMDKPITDKAVSKALGRAAADVWDYGCRNNLERIFCRPLLEQPTPKGLILTLAEYLYEEKDKADSGCFINQAQAQQLFLILSKLSSGR